MEFLIDHRLPPDKGTNHVHLPCPLRSSSPSSSFGRPGPVLRAHAYAVQRRARRPARVHAVAALLNVLLLLNVTVAIWLALGILH